MCSSIAPERSFVNFLCRNAKKGWVASEFATFPSSVCTEFFVLHTEFTLHTEFFVLHTELALHTERATRGSSYMSPSLTCAEFTPHAEFTSHADLPMCRVCEHSEEDPRPLFRVAYYEDPSGDISSGTYQGSEMR